GGGRADGQLQASAQAGREALSKDLGRDVRSHGRTPPRLSQPGPSKRIAGRARRIASIPIRAMKNSLPRKPCDELRLDNFDVHPLCDRVSERTGKLDPSDGERLRARLAQLGQGLPTTYQGSLSIGSLTFDCEGRIG